MSGKVSDIHLKFHYIGPVVPTSHNITQPKHHRETQGPQGDPNMPRIPEFLQILHG